MATPVLLLDPDQWRFRGMQAVIDGNELFHVVGERDFARILTMDRPPDDMFARVALVSDRLIVDYGVSVVPQIADLFPSAGILVHGDHESTDVSVRVIAAGASGYFDLSAPLEYLNEAVAAVSEGRMWAPREAVQTLAQEWAAGIDPAAPGPEAPVLSDDDLLLMRYLHEGLSPREVAARLQCAEITIKARLERLYRGYGVTTRQQLLNAALSEGLVVR